MKKNAENMKDTDSHIILKALISIAEIKELTQFISQYAQKDSEFQTELVNVLSSHYLSDTEASYRKKVADAFETCDTGRNSNYWDNERDWDIIIENILKLLEIADSLIIVNKPIQALGIAVQTLKSLGESCSYEYCYEDDIDFSDICTRAGEVILRALPHPACTEKKKKAVAKELSDISQYEIYQEYDTYDIDKLSNQVNVLVLSDTEALKLIDKRLKEAKEYQQAEWVYRKVELLQKMGKGTEADAVIQEYLYLPEIRNVEIEKLENNHLYDKALCLIDEGISIAQQREHYGTEKDWMEKKLHIYELQKDEKAIITCCRNIFVNYNGGIEYYRKLKKKIPPTEWTEFLYSMIKDAQLRDSITLYNNLKAEIYKEEGDYDKLFELISRSGYYCLDVLTHYAPILKKTHSRQMLDLFVPLLKGYAKSHVQSKAYIRIAEILKIMQKLEGGKPVVNELVTFFRAEYRRRPSMMAELAIF